MLYPRLALALPLLASLAACSAPFNPHPVGYASMGILCAPRRAVYCSTDAELRHCVEVAVAVAEIDSVIPGLLEYRGRLTWDEMAMLRRQDAGVTVVADVPRSAMPGVPTGALAVTLANPGAESACLGFTPIALLWRPSEITQEREYAVVLHELMHSLGAAHADGDCRWQTIMDRAPTHHGLAIIDRNWLRAVYGR